MAQRHTNKCIGIKLLSASKGAPIHFSVITWYANKRNTIYVDGSGVGGDDVVWYAVV
jgi:hypothetical protein